MNGELGLILEDSMTPTTGRAEFFEPGLPVLPDEDDTASCASALTNRRLTSAGHGRPNYSYDFFFFALDLRFRLDFGGSSTISSISCSGTSSARQIISTFATRWRERLSVFLRRAAGRKPKAAG